MSNITSPSTYSGACFMTNHLFNHYDISRTDSVNPTWSFLVAVNGLTAPPTVIINALVVWTVLKDENLRSSPFNTALASLALTDSLVGLFVQPSYCVFLGCLLNKNCEISKDCAYTAYTMSMLGCCSLSMMTLTIACLERYLAIQQQTFYERNVTWTRLLKTMIITWLIGLTYLISSTIFLNTNKLADIQKVPGIVGMLFFGLIALYCSCSVQITAYRQKRAITKQIASVQQQSNQEQVQKLKEFKKVFLMSLLVVSSFGLYVPYIAVAVIEKKKNEDDSSDFKYIATMSALTFIHLQSLINPIFMTIRLSYIRKKLKKNLLRFKCWKTNTGEEH